MPKTRYSIVAHVYDKRQRLISVATNSYKKTHPLQAYFAKKVGHSERIFLHAEIRALIKCKDKIPHTLYVYRYGTGGEMLCAKPCPICMEAIRAFGISRLFYSDPDAGMIDAGL